MSAVLLETVGGPSRSEAVMLASRSEIGDRVRRVITRLLEEQRWPSNTQLTEMLPRHVGAVLAEHPLTARDRAAKLRTAGAAATYCWSYLPNDAWRLVRLTDDDVDTAPPLVWSGPDGLVADRVLVGQQRSIEAAADAAWEWAQDLSRAVGAAITAVRVLPLAHLPQALLVEAEGHRLLTGSRLDLMGGIWR